MFTTGAVKYLARGQPQLVSRGCVQWYHTVKSDSLKLMTAAANVFQMLLMMMMNQELLSLGHCTGKREWQLEDVQLPCLVSPLAAEQSLHLSMVDRCGRRFLNKEVRAINH